MILPTFVEAIRTIFFRKIKNDWESRVENERVAMEAQRNSMRQMYGTFDQINNKEFNEKVDRISRVKSSDGTFLSFNINKLRAAIEWSIIGHEKDASADVILHEVINTIFDCVSAVEIADALIMASSSYIEFDPAYNYVAAQLSL